MTLMYDYDMALLRIEFSNMFITTGWEGKGE